MEGIFSLYLNVKFNDSASLIFLISVCRISDLNERKEKWQGEAHSSFPYECLHFIKKFYLQISMLSIRNSTHHMFLCVAYFTFVFTINKLYCIISQSNISRSYATFFYIEKHCGSFIWSYL